MVVPMKITWKEVREAEDAVQRVLDDRTVSDCEVLQPFFAQRPHLLFPLGFDEYVPFSSRLNFGAKWIGFEPLPSAMHDRMLRGAIDCMSPSLFRRPTGQWLALGFVAAGKVYASQFGKLCFHSKQSFNEWIDAMRKDPDNCRSNYATTIQLDELFASLYRVADKWLDESHTVWTPQLWTPDSQENVRVSLRAAVEDLIVGLKKQRTTLSALTWPQYEELVAELLRGIGMDVYRLTTRPQGGRDLLARGELIPGEEPVTIAVEIKHKDVVYRPAVEAALWQNRAFPALLFVTSGRFSAGVLNEKRKEENRFRLFLKDGEAVGDLLKSYQFGR